MAENEKIFSTETEALLDQLDRRSTDKLHFRVEVGRLIEAASSSANRSTFDDLIFRAKFAVKTRDVMKRIGPGAEGFEKLSKEFQESIKETSSLLAVLTSSLPQNDREEFRRQFLQIESASFQNLLLLLSDLAAVKNWLIDGHSLPTESPRKSGNHSSSSNQITLKQLRASSVVALLLLAAFLVIEPPVTTIGWALAGLVSVTQLAILLTIISLVSRRK